MKRRILLVDDAADLRQMYAEFFQREGFLTLQAENAVDALRLAGEMHPDVAVIDLGLPGINGLELVHRLRNGDTTSRLPMVVLTGRALPADEPVAIAAGCDRFLVKPCPPDHLLAEIQAAIDRSNATSRATPRKRAGLAEG